MYLSRLTIDSSRIALKWIANPYRVHQRLMMGCDGEPRLLFRIEEQSQPIKIIVQTKQEPDWEAAFDDFPVLTGLSEHKFFDPLLVKGGAYRFRLLANPTVRRDGCRLGLLNEEDQRSWLDRKMQSAGAKLLGCLVRSNGFVYSTKAASKHQAEQTHLAVQYDGLLKATSPELLRSSLEAGIGSAKGYGFGLLSLAARN